MAWHWRWHERVAVVTAAPVTSLVMPRIATRPRLPARWACPGPRIGDGSSAREVDLPGRIDVTR